FVFLVFYLVFRVVFLVVLFFFFFFFNDTATTEIYTTRHTLSLHDALPIWSRCQRKKGGGSMSAPPPFLSNPGGSRGGASGVPSPAHLFIPERAPAGPAGTGSLPSASLVSATKAGSSRSDEKTASTRASIISLARTER